LPDPHQLLKCLVLPRPDTFSKWCIFSQGTTIFFPRQACGHLHRNKGFFNVAKTRATKRTAKAKQQSSGDVEVAVCRRRGERRHATSTASAASATASKASAVPTKTPKATKAAKATKPTKTAGGSRIEAAQGSRPVIVPGERRKKVARRRQIDPTTCERDYTGDEIEFMHALDAYKRSSGRMFPTCSEILEVVRGLGYARARDGAAFTAGSPAKDAENAQPSEAEVGRTFLEHLG
jgi:hypothetical protein